ncbi:DUF6252 family protein [Hanstruepera flava]|uniref:DUF6252 family protein n=1 Tax=Hanstruepera flava TaxID=2930218 RepID=UPI002028846E|nr:DUF6252 family protein [Hanstruepera flava]
MRTLKQIMLFAMVLGAFSFSSCSSDDDGGNPADTTAGSGTITAKIDGSSFTSLEMTSIANKVTAGGQSTLVIQGNTQSQAFQFTINAYDGVGTYEFTDANVFRIASYIEPNVSNPANTQTWSAPYENSGVAGEISISEETDSNIKGTFFFTGKNSNDNSTKSITEGSFNLTLQVQ